jgi:hypothetical protein
MKERVIFIVAVIAFIAVVPVVYYFLFERGLSSPEDDQKNITLLPKEPEPKKEDKVAAALQITKVEGKVEVQREGQEWQQAELKTVLGPKDSIRTGPVAKAELGVEGLYSVEMEGSSEFKVKSLADNVSKFMLKEGMISADVAEDAKQSFEIDAANTTAKTDGGAFKMSVNKQGLVALGTSRGSVDVEAEGKVIQVKEGYYTRVTKGEQPKDPIQIPSKLFLKVRWPKKKVMKKRKLMVSGKTAPGSSVRVEGVTVSVDSTGKFSKLVALREGANKVKVESIDVGGNIKELISPAMVVDTQADAFQIKTGPDMWKKKKRLREKN